MPTEAELWLAVDRLRSGAGAKGDRYRGLTLPASAQTLREAIRELLDLRASSRELICKNCQTITRFNANVSLQRGACECGMDLQPLAYVQMAAMRKRISSLEEQVARLTEVISVAFDLS